MHSQMSNPTFQRTASRPLNQGVRQLMSRPPYRRQIERALDAAALDASETQRIWRDWYRPGLEDFRIWFSEVELSALAKFDGVLRPIKGATHDTGKALHDEARRTLQVFKSRSS